MTSGSQRPVTWTLAGSDPSGGAGFQADLKTMHALGTYPCTVITAVIAQNTCGVASIRPVSAALLRAQVDCLRTDLPPRAVKVGMLARAPLVRETARALRALATTVVCDPVLCSSSGTVLLDRPGVHMLRTRLLARIDLLTPNLPEVEVLTGKPVRGPRQVAAAAAALLAEGIRAVLIKGGHGQGPDARDYFTDGIQAAWIVSPRMRADRHGTGCTLSAAITAALARGHEMLEAVTLGKAYINQGLRLAPELGRGRGPLEHGGWPTDPRDQPRIEWINH